MAKNKSTPEEQLLDLIEKGDSFKSLRPKQKKSTFGSFFNLRKFWLFFPSLKRTLRTQLTRLKGRIKEPNLKVLNKVLIGIAVALIAYLIADFTIRQPDINQISKKISTGAGQRFKEEPKADIRPFLYYLEMVQRRNIFSPVVLKSAESTDADAKKLLVSLVGELKLVGISWSENPEAMIEDKKAKKTYFLKTGDMINKLQVEDISKDRVILSHDGKKMELM